MSLDLEFAQKQDVPNNPVVRTESRDEYWWSRGHATLVEDVAGQWWMIYHGYEHGFWTLGRQALLEPIEWTEDGWFVAKGGDLSRPIRKPAGTASGPHGMPLSDDVNLDELARMESDDKWGMLAWLTHEKGYLMGRAWVEAREERVLALDPGSAAPVFWLAAIAAREGRRVEV